MKAVLVSFKSYGSHSLSYFRSFLRNLLLCLLNLSFLQSRTTIHELTNRYTDMKIDKIVGIESRGFILGAPLAYLLGVGFVPIRKKGKLPAETLGHYYELEYGVDRIEIHIDAVSKGDRVLLVDDLIATEGTAEAAVKLIEKMEGEIIKCCFAIDLPDIGGRTRLESLGQKVFALCEFEGE